MYRSQESGSPVQRTAERNSQDEGKEKTQDTSCALDLQSNQTGWNSALEDCRSYDPKEKREVAEFRNYLMFGRINNSFKSFTYPKLIQLF